MLNVPGMRAMSYGRCLSICLSALCSTDQHSSDRISTALIKREDNSSTSQGHTHLSLSSSCCIDFSVFLSCFCFISHLCLSLHPSVIFSSLLLCFYWLCLSLSLFLALIFSLLSQCSCSITRLMHFLSLTFDPPPVSLLLSYSDYLRYQLLHKVPLFMYLPCVLLVRGGFL